MREPLENGPPQSYERPNQKWVCGLNNDGRACPAGPNSGGVCPALAECTPIRDGDRWKCNRSQLRGGPCDEGPLHEGGCSHVNRCHPVRSLRSKRGRFLAACALLTAGALLAIVDSDWRNVVISPGPLALPHAQLTATTNKTQQCSACHAAADDGLIGWTASLFAGHSDGPSQSQRCLECHQKTIAPDLALVAHNAQPALLAAITKREAELFSMASNESEPAAAKLACATCHHEHQGASFNLTALDNASCQACHARRYDSFAVDHPDFGLWPYERRTRIAFNHATHEAKHFAERKRPFDCRTCHWEDATQRVERLASYEAACASCHDEKIKTSVAQGVPMLMLPTLDIEALQTVGANVDPWPSQATGDFDGQLPLAMKLLLAADSQAVQAMEALGADFEFADIDPDNKDQLRAAVELATAIKRLLAELGQSAPETVRSRLASALVRRVSEAETNALLSGLSNEALRAAVETWLPDTAKSEASSTTSQVSRFQISEQSATTPEPRTLNPVIAFAPAGAWNRDDAKVSLRYKPSGHADPVLTEWLEIVATSPAVDQQPLTAAILKEMTKPTAAGLCVSCHSVEQNNLGQLAINWRADGRTAEPRTLTKFSHGPHLTLPQLANCTACHALEKTAEPTPYVGWDPHTFASEFQPLTKRVCAECHTASAAGDRCQSCHNYHVQTVESWRSLSGTTQTSGGTP